MCAATSSNTRMSSPSLVSGLHSHEAVMVEGQGEREREREERKKGEYEKKVQCSVLKFHILGGDTCNVRE